MKTSKITKAKGKKFFSFILTVVMAIGKLPQMTMPVFADEYIISAEGELNTITLIHKAK